MKLNHGDLTITSAAFSHGERIPDAHAGPDSTSPPLAWTDVPEDAVCLVLIVHDPDAPLTYGFTHWILSGIPADRDGLGSGDDGGARLGANSMGGSDWIGPGPIPGHGTHHYYFDLYALSADPGLDPDLGRAEVLGRIDDLIIEQARIVGTYSN